MVTCEKVDVRGGKDVFLYTLTSAAGQVQVTNYGGIITSIVVPDKNGEPGEVTLGFEKVTDYYVNPPYLGCAVGRYANRIDGGKFTLNGVDYELFCNENGVNCLHGGKVGFDKVVWDSEIVGESVAMHYFSPDMEEGFPGNLDVTITYSFDDEGNLGIAYTAKSDSDTLLNLTNHAYFNLNGGKSEVYDHELTIAASRFTPVGQNSIPTGEIADVSGTPFDFTVPKLIGKDCFADCKQLKLVGGGYDHNYVVDGEGMRFMARAFDRESGRVMETYSDLPAVQLYVSNMLGDLKGKLQYHKHYAFCLETQGYPDAIHHENFPSCVLKAGEEWKSVTRYRFFTE